jgi:hypothetical protein
MLCAVVQLHTTDIKADSAAPPEVGRLTPENVENLVIVNMKVYLVGYVIVILL